MSPLSFLPPERWHTLEPLLDAALELPPEQRSAFLDGACGDDPALRAELESMLAECTGDDAYLSRPAAERFATLLDGRDELAQLREAIATHYAVERELGRGGMGTVYLARDLRHERDVAVKVLAPELADGASAARFLDEIRLTARLRHPHILPLFDSGVANGRPWYATPYVEGGTLRDRLAREGALPLAETPRVLREVASALAHAHAHGVVHRDVKPENVLLDVGGAVLGDFGIARAIERAAGADASPVVATLTAPAFGTPTYMAPEQGTPGAPVDRRADLYALGVIAYEMLCGHPPHSPPSREGAQAALELESPAPIARLRPDVPDALATLISHLLAERPEDRISSADDVLRALDAIGSSGSTPGEVPARVPARPEARRRWALIGALSAAGVLTIAGATGWAVHTRRTVESPPARRVLVVPFENTTGDPALAPLGRMAADWIAQGLAETGAVDVSSEPLPPGAVGERGLRAMARQIDVGTLVSGTYHLDGDSVRLQARIINVADWTLLRAVAPVGAARSAPETLLDPLRQRVMAVLAITHDPRMAGWAMGSPPPTFEAYELLVAGFDVFATGNWEGALPLWARAAALDSSFVQPLLHSVFAYTNLGRWAEADSLARLIARRDALAPFDQAMLAFQRGEIDGDNAAVLAAARDMVRATPGAGLPHYLHALAAFRVNRPREALDAAGRLSSRAGRFATTWANALYWGVVTSAHHMLGEHDAELQSVRAARELHPGNRDILAYELRALVALGRIDGLELALDQLEGLPATPAGRTLSNLLIQLADELEAHGHPAAARSVLLRTDRWQRTRDTNAEYHTSALYDRARTLHRLGDDDAADLIFARLAADRPANPHYLAYRGIIAARRNRTADVQRITDQLRAMRVPYDRGATTHARARIAARSGDRALALTLLRQALAEGVVFGTPLHTALEFAVLRDEPEFRELLRPKG